MSFVIEREKDFDEKIGLSWERSIVKEPIDNDVAVIILKQDYKDVFDTETFHSYDIKLWGKSIKDWVCLAFDKCPILELNIENSDNVLDTIRPYLSDKKYTAVFYADTPLFKRKTFLSVLDYVQTKHLNVCKLERGFIFITDYIKKADRLYTTVYPDLVAKEEFLVAKDMCSIEQISHILKERIIDYHLQQGVRFLDKSSVSIDADVVIGKNVIIYPNNTLEGATVIMEGAKLYNGNVIINSRIGKNVVLRYDVIQESDINDFTALDPFVFIDKGIVRR